MKILHENSEYNYNYFNINGNFFIIILFIELCVTKDCYNFNEIYLYLNSKSFRKKFKVKK